jgi:hypothetical protein
VTVRHGSLGARRNPGSRGHARLTQQDPLANPQSGFLFTQSLRRGNTP